MKDSATPRYHDMTGQVFGRLTALRYLRSNGTNTYWLVRCLCGNEFTTQRSALVTGHTQSCGCLRKHGLAGTRAHMSWISMNTRCHNPNRNNWADYGGRGISICERWRRFLNFYADMGERPIGLSLDRINNDGNYEPDNCRWATRLEQNRNRRKT